jgi:hypothetical protein
MKIAIGINIFKSYDRQTRCIDVLKKLKRLYSNIELYNISFDTEKNLDDDFIHLPFLRKRAKDIINGSVSEKPISKEFFDVLSKQECDYFLFLNSDILISEKLLKEISSKKFETMIFSRHDIYPISNLNDKIIPFKIEIAGFDCWCVKKEWWVKNNNIFEDFIYAEPLWDVDFSLKMFNYSDCILQNKEFFIAHEKHDLNWNETSLEAKHNSLLWGKTPYHKKWHEFIYNNLIYRKPHGQFLIPLNNEKELENKFLKI